MAIKPDYSAGLATLANGGTTVTFSGGANITAADIQPGDTFKVQNLDAIIASVTDSTHVELTEAWTGDALAAEPYRIRYQPDGSRLSAATRDLIETLGNGNVLALANLDGEFDKIPIFTGPGAMTLIDKADLIQGVAFDVQVDLLADRDAYDAELEGFRVLVSDVGDGRSALYTKASDTAGDWSAPSYITGPVGPVGPTGYNPRGTYSGATAYAVGDLVLDNGSTWSAIAPTTGNAPPVLPVTSNAWWQLVAAKGTDGTGTGDIVGPASAVNNNLAAFDTTTGKLIKDSGITPSVIGSTILEAATASLVRQAIKVGDNYVNIDIYGGGSGGDDAVIAETLFAANPGSIIHFGDKNYNLNTELNVPAQNGNGIKGVGANNTIFLKNSTALTGIKFDGTGVVGWNASDFRINGIGGTQTAGYGIDMPGVVGQGRVQNIHVYDCWRGIGLGPTDFSWLENCIVTNSYSHGFYLRNLDGLPAASLQWLNNNNLAQMNDGAGMIYESVAASGLSQVTTGTITNYSSFANTLFGFGAIGASGIPIEGVRLVNCFLGEDGQFGASFETRGGKHLITGGFYELIGRGTTGRNKATAAPTGIVGSGISFGANEGMVNVNGAHIDGNALDGIISQAGYCNINGVTAINNGGRLSAGRRNGIYHLGGIMSVTGGMMRNIGTTTQLFGITTADSANLTVVGGDLRGNATGAINYGTNEMLAMVIGVRGANHRAGEGSWNLGNATPVAGQVAGTINSIGLYKNNSAYVNP